MLVAPEKQHSLTGGSSCQRWMNCPGSVQLIAKSSVGDTSSFYADEGTAAHHLLSVCLENNKVPWVYMNKAIQVGSNKFTVTTEMSKHVHIAIKFVNSVITEHKEQFGEAPVVHIEHALSSEHDANIFGELDIMIECQNRLMVIDFKYGRGVVVEPDSWQNRYYGYLAAENSTRPYDLETSVELWIIQPRIPHPEGRIRKYETTVQELLTLFQEQILPGVWQTRDPDAMLNAGSWCRFCPVKHHCPAF